MVLLALLTIGRIVLPGILVALALVLRVALLLLLLLLLPPRLLVLLLRLPPRTRRGLPLASVGRQPPLLLARILRRKKYRPRTEPGAWV